MSHNPASILIVDDHPLLRKGLIQLIELEDELEVVAEASNGNDAIKIALELEPDLIILDVNMQGIDGLETLSIMRNKGVTSHIIIFTVSDNNEDIITAIRSGADGYLLKDMDPEEIIKQIKQALSGQIVISEKLSSILASALRHPKTQKQEKNILSTLTSRELETLQLIAKGMCNKLIARELNISDGTVKVHVKHILKKLNMRSRVEAAVWMVTQQHQQD